MSLTAEAEYVRTPVTTITSPGDLSHRVIDIEESHCRCPECALRHASLGCKS